MIPGTSFGTPCRKSAASPDIAVTSRTHRKTSRPAARYADPRFRLSIRIYVTEAQDLYRESMRHRETCTTAHASIADALRASPDCETLRAVLREICDGAWLGGLKGE